VENGNGGGGASVQTRLPRGLCNHKIPIHSIPQNRSLGISDPPPFVAADIVGSWSCWFVCIMHQSNEEANATTSQHVSFAFCDTSSLVCVPLLRTIAIASYGVVPPIGYRGFNPIHSSSPPECPRTSIHLSSLYVSCTGISYFRGYLLPPAPCVPSR